MSLVEIIRELCDRVEDSELSEITQERILWNILTALRGPDTWDSSDLKSLTTARVRGILGVSPNCGAVCNYLKLPTETLALRDKLLYMEDPIPFNLSHFRYHFDAALRGLQQLGYDNVDEVTDPIRGLKDG